MSVIIHSGEMESTYHLPYHITDTDITIVFEEDIINLVCQENVHIYEEHFWSSPNYFLFDMTVKGSKAFPLLSFINECLNIFDYHEKVVVKGRRELSESFTYISERVTPIVTAVAEVQPKGIKPGESPAILFEREIRNSHQG